MGRVRILFAGWLTRDGLCVVSYPHQQEPPPKGQTMYRLAEAHSVKVHQTIILNDNYMSPGPERWRERSRTFTGIADAMATQWGSLT